MSMDFPENAPESKALYAFLSCVEIFVSHAGCPGTKSDDAGKTKACEGCPNLGICASRQVPDPGTLCNSL